MFMGLKYNRILLKISGEALGGDKGAGFDEAAMDSICGGVKKAYDLGVQLGIVVGAATSGAAAPAAGWSAPWPTRSGCWPPS